MFPSLYYALNDTEKESVCCRNPDTSCSKLCASSLPFFSVKVKHCNNYIINNISDFNCTLN